MSIIAALRSAHIARLQAAGLGKTVQAHHGRFTIRDLKEMGAAAPSIRLGFVGRAKGDRLSDRRFRLMADFVAVIVTRAGTRDDADDEALDLAVRTATEIASLPMAGLAGCGPAEEIEIDAVDAEDAELQRLVIVAVTWSHPVTAGRSAFAADPDAPRAGPPRSIAVNGEVFAAADAGGGP